jgi:RND family efflux transporter MFP subunit
VRLQANVGEKDVSSIRVGSPVTVVSTGGGPAPITARVTAVFPFVEQGPRTAVVEALIENVGRRFLPGQYVMLEFVTGARADALTVPRDAVVRLGGTAKVWVAKDGRAEPREVVTGLKSADRVEIVRGLEADEHVIVRGQEALYAGARVTDTPGRAPATGSAGDAHQGMPGMKGQEEKPATKEAPHGSH